MERKLQVTATQYYFQYITTDYFKKQLTRHSLDLCRTYQQSPVCRVLEGRHNV